VNEIALHDGGTNGLKQTVVVLGNVSPDYVSLRRSENEFPGVGGL